MKQELSRRAFITLMATGIGSFIYTQDEAENKHKKLAQSFIASADRRKPLTTDASSQSADTRTRWPDNKSVLVDMSLFATGLIGYAYHKRSLNTSTLHNIKPHSPDKEPTLS